MTATSTTRRRLLALLFGHPGQRFHQREIARVVDSGLGSVQRELGRLVEAGHDVVITLISLAVAFVFTPWLSKRMLAGVGAVHGAGEEHTWRGGPTSSRHGDL